VRLDKYQLGRDLAAEREAKLENYGTPEAEHAARRENEIGRAIEAAGGWDADVERGYMQAKREFARERYEHGR
jgi:hypothetical protein